MIDSRPDDGALLSARILVVGVSVASAVPQRADWAEAGPTVRLTNSNVRRAGKTPRNVLS